MVFYISFLFLIGVIGIIWLYAFTDVEKKIERTCKNCKFQIKLADEKPCIECIYKDKKLNWEAK